MNPSDPCVASVREVSLSYGRNFALDRVTLSFPSGKRIALIGPDGVGKSSLLSLIAGSRRIQTGKVTVLGGDMRDIRHRAAVCSKIAYMPQGLGKNLYPDLSVGENIAFFARLFGQAKAEREASHRGIDREHGSEAVHRSAGPEALRRHAAEAWALLRSRP